jgi:hypothetical protein
MWMNREDLGSLLASLAGSKADSALPESCQFYLQWDSGIMATSFGWL